MKLLEKIFRNFLLAPVLLILLFEEWGWEPLLRAVKKLATLPFWAKLESAVAALPPWGALLAFAVPVLSLIPVKLLALLLFAQGHGVVGLTLVIAAKVLGTAMAARLFELTEPALMQLAWFARFYPTFKSWKNRLLAQVRQSALWRGVRLVKAQLRHAVEKFWQSHTKP